jgi:choline dehydrogenase
MQAQGAVGLHDLAQQEGDHEMKRYSSADTFDYVIVGGGAAGCVLASRLTEDANASVCLLEAGPRDNHPAIRIPGSVVKILFNPKLTWQFHTEPSPGSAGRRVYVPQGRTLGGSSAINGMIYNRGQPIDFDSWAQAGNHGWSYSDLLPYFKRTERRIGGQDNEFRGRNGCLPVTDTDWRPPFVEAFIAGVAALGVPRNPDYNGASQEGVGYMQRLIHRGWRVSASHAFLRPAAGRPGLDIRCNARVHCIEFQGKRAVGVTYCHGSSTDSAQSVKARREVLVSSGAINGPKLLQLSGVGDPAHLKEIDAPVLHSLPGVGHNLQDHYGARSVVRIRNSRTANDLARWPHVGFEVLKWMFGRPSIVGLSASIVHVFWKSDDAQDRPDLQFVLTPISFKAGQFGVLDDFPGMSLGVWPHRPQSRGFIRARSTNPLEDPLIQPNYLSAGADQRTLVAGLKLARKFLATKELSHFVEREEVPGPRVSTDDEFLGFARKNGSTIYHFSGSNKMGPAHDRTAVVGPDLKVHGLEALRVVDASIMPSLPSANTYAATLAIAEKASDLIKTGQ